MVGEWVRGDVLYKGGAQFAVKAHTLLHQSDCVGREIAAPSFRDAFSYRSDVAHTASEVQHQFLSSLSLGYSQSKYWRSFKQLVLFTL